MGKAREVSGGPSRERRRGDAKALPDTGTTSPAPVAPGTSDLGLAWAPWQTLAAAPAFSPDVLAETLDGGQSFRWNRQPDGSWLGTWSEHVIRLRLGGDERLEWTTPRGADLAGGARALSGYLALDRDFAALADTLPWRSDPHLARGLVAFHGLRILRQPFGETLLGFLCSATKQIVQIKQMLALLAQRHGRPLFRQTAEDNPTASAAAEQPAALHRLPTWPELARIPEHELRACLLGFRARYIAETAQFLAAHPGWLEETETLSYAAAKERLCGLPGVGEKVADCVLLFGAGRLEAFPVDVWILKTLARHYGLEGWRTPQLAHFGRVHFGPLAGLAQQYLFAWERRAAKTTAAPAPTAPANR